jgi:hypothetical protein
MAEALLQLLECPRAGNEGVNECIQRILPGSHY